MNNIAIVSDSSISFTDNELKKYNVHTIPNVIIHNNQTYLDQITISSEEIETLLKNKETITTSQPNIGQIVEILEDLETRNYDHIIILPISSALSGGYEVFNQAAEIADLKNYTVIETYSVGGPVQQAVRAIRSMNKQNRSISEIIKFLNHLFANQVSYLFPESLDQIVASGRVSKAGGKIASLLRIKPAVYLKQKGRQIDRFAIARTDQRIFKKIIKHFNDNHVKPETHDLYILESRALDKVKDFKEHLFKELGKFTSYTVTLPAALSVHAGVGAIVIQWCLKVPE